MLDLMRVRPIRPETEPDFDHQPSESAAVITPGPNGVLRFRVPTSIIGWKFAAVALFAALTTIATQLPQRGVGLAVTVGLVIYAGRDLFARQRLVADPDTVLLVRGYASHRRLAWSEIERVRVDERQRLGTRTQTLEIDAGDAIYLFTRSDLGVEPGEALAALEQLRDH